MQRTFLADMQEKALRELLKGERKFPTIFYPRVFRRKAKYVQRHKEDFVKVRITIEFNPKSQ